MGACFLWALLGAFFFGLAGYGSILWWCRRLEMVWGAAAFDDDLDDDLPAMIL